MGGQPHCTPDDTAPARTPWRWLCSGMPFAGLLVVSACAGGSAPDATPSTSSATTVPNPGTVQSTTTAPATSVPASSSVSSTTTTAPPVEEPSGPVVDELVAQGVVDVCSLLPSEPLEAIGFDLADAEQLSRTESLSNLVAGKRVYDPFDPWPDVYQGVFSRSRCSLDDDDLQVYLSVDVRLFETPFHSLAHFLAGTTTQSDRFESCMRSEALGEHNQAAATSARTIDDPAGVPDTRSGLSMYLAVDRYFAHASAGVPIDVAAPEALRDLLAAPLRDVIEQATGQEISDGPVDLPVFSFSDVSPGSEQTCPYPDNDLPAPQSSDEALAVCDHGEAFEATIGVPADWLEVRATTYGTACLYRESTTGTFASAVIVEVDEADPSATGLDEFEAQLALDYGVHIWGCCSPGADASTFMRPVDGVEGAFESINDDQLVWIEGDDSSAWVRVSFGTLAEQASNEYTGLKRNFLTALVTGLAP